VTEQQAALSAYYSAPTASFLAEEATSILGKMAGRSSFDIDLSQRSAWVTEIQFLKARWKDSRERSSSSLTSRDSAAESTRC
jgi:hypothetical protein